MFDDMFMKRVESIRLHVMCIWYVWNEAKWNESRRYSKNYTKRVCLWIQYVIYAMKPKMTWTNNKSLPWRHSDEEHWWKLTRQLRSLKDLKWRWKFIRRPNSLLYTKSQRYRGIVVGPVHSLVSITPTNPRILIFHQPAQVEGFPTETIWTVEWC